MLTTLTQNWFWESRNYAVFLIWMIFIPCAAATPPAEFQEQLLLVDINRQQLNQTVLVLENKMGVLYLWGKDLQRWRLLVPNAKTSITYQGEHYFPLNAILGVSHVYDPQKLTLTIEVRPEAFIKTVRTSEYSTMQPPTKSGTGGFFNYDLFFARSPGSNETSGQFEVGYFNHFGVGISNMLANNMNNRLRMTRLDTTWTIDDPEKLQTLHLGDAVTLPGTWGNSVRFGGIQFGTNFATQPGFDTFPPQNVVGQAILPSTVDVFINNALVSSQNVPPGPFSIRNLPVVTGEGNVRLVVRDLFGREQTINRPFYASQTLLRAGLENFSFELGWIRDNFGIESNDYSHLLTSGTYRRGLSERFTTELHAEAISHQAAAGFGGDYLIPQLGTVGTYVAGSHNLQGNGELLLIGMDRLAQPWSFGAHTQWASSGFSQVGLQLSQPPSIQLSSLNLSYATLGKGSLGFVYVTQHNRVETDTRIATLSYNASLGKAGSFTLSALHTMAGGVSTTIFAMLSYSLDAATSFTGSAQSLHGSSAGSSHDFSMTLERNLPLGEGYGYQIQARTDGYKEAAYSFQNNTGTYSIDFAQNENVTASRLDISGGLAILGDNLFVSRRIDQSFAVASIADYANVRILADNQPAGRTDVNGNALIPRLRAYDINWISVDQRDIPLDAEIATLKEQAVPYFRSGIEVKFPVKHSLGATFTIYLENGQLLPVGASVEELGTNKTYMVGYGGEVYVGGLVASSRLRATWNNQTCEFDVKFTPGTDPLPDLGKFICREDHP